MDTEDCASGYCQIYEKCTPPLPRLPQRFSSSTIRNERWTVSLTCVEFICCSLLGWRYFPKNLTIKCILLQSLITPFVLLSAGFLNFPNSSPQRVFILRNGRKILSTKRFLAGVSDRSYINSLPHFQGPSMRYFDFIKYPSNPVADHDLVPALICLQPFPCMKQYLVRERSTMWPIPNTLSKIAATPGVLVPTGRKGSLNVDTEWRYSFSVQEICLSQEMPGWVKTGYRAFKYTLKHLSHALRISVDSTDEEVLYQDESVKQLIDRMVSAYTKYRMELPNWGFRLDLANEDESKFCTYHMKSILFWSLEDQDTWKEPCPFRLMLRLLNKLEGHLRSGILPHYFNIECNLFANIPRKELALINACVVEILSDPVAAMCHTAVNPNISRNLADFGISGKKQMIIRKRRLYTAVFYLFPVLQLLTLHYIFRLSYVYFPRFRNIHIRWKWSAVLRLKNGLPRHIAFELPFLRTLYLDYDIWWDSTHKKSAYVSEKPVSILVTAWKEAGYKPFSKQLSRQ